uniref:Ragulator complex protein LAMTOR1 n=1 Tax=Ascaris lumbricoides TaxID=6252 RepID=A0A0M3HXW2_ASCLU
MPSSSAVPKMPIVLCGCCRSPSKRKQEKANDLQAPRVTTVFDPTQHSFNVPSAERLPVIVVSCPSTPSLEPAEADMQESLCLDAEDLYFTARTSRKNDDDLKEMADLVREIRIEAGLPVTPPRESNLNMQSRVSDHTDQEVSSSKSTDGKFFKEFAIKKEHIFSLVK